MFKSDAMKSRLRRDAFEQFLLAAETALRQGKIAVAAEVFNQALVADSRLGGKKHNAEQWKTHALKRGSLKDEVPFTPAKKELAYTSTTQWKSFGRKFFKKRNERKRLNDGERNIFFTPMIERCLAWEQRRPRGSRVLR